MSSLPWFRLYHRIVDDEKLRLLAFEDRWHFVALLSLKAAGLMDGKRDALWQRKVAVKLGVQLREMDEITRRLQEVGLIDEDLNPLAWDELQYKSDNSTDRVRAYRKRQEKQGRNDAKRDRNVSVTVQEKDTETDADSGSNEPQPRKRGRACRIPSDWMPSDLPSKVNALASQWPEGRMERELDGFRDYWTARNRDAARVDWDKVWHNRIRDIHDRVMVGQGAKRGGREGYGGSLADIGNEVRELFNG